MKEYVKADYGEAMAVSELNDDSEVTKMKIVANEEEESSDEESSSRVKMIMKLLKMMCFRSRRRKPNTKSAFKEGEVAEMQVIRRIF